MVCQTDPHENQESARRAADHFVHEERAFHLGFLPTEQSHPYTRDFSKRVIERTADGISRLLAVDGDVPPVVRRVVTTEAFDSLVSEIARVQTDPRRRICFSGCGSTGRLAIILEAMWRRYWESVQPDVAERACSIMTGGDRALIRSVENFEDYEAFGARQVADLGLEADDLLIAVSEGGETSSVIGTAREALRRGCRVFFVYNNPTEILRTRIERSRELIDDPHVTTIDLFSGPMAITGSTRMQATTAEMLLLGMAIEEAVGGGSTGAVARIARVDAFAALLAALNEEANLSVLASIAEREAEIYREEGRVTYFAGEYLLDIFSDTTERSPTFKVPPFRRLDDDDAAPASWAFAKDPSNPTDRAWSAMLRREPRGLDWSSGDYREMGSPAALSENPPDLGRTEIHRYAIGNEPDPSRYGARRSLAFSVSVNGEEVIDSAGFAEPFSERATLRITTDERSDGNSDSYTVRIPAIESSLQLYEHLAVKLVFNTISTATMGLLGRIRGNWMIQVDPTNKKLIDRGSRIIASLAGIEYEEACYQLYLSIELQRKSADVSVHTSSPVLTALERLL